MTGGSNYSVAVFDEQFAPAERVLRGRDGQVPEQAGDTLDGHAAPVRPRHGREHFVALQEAGVRLPEKEAGPLDAGQLHQPVNDQSVSGLVTAMTRSARARRFLLHAYRLLSSPSWHHAELSFSLGQMTSPEKVTVNFMPLLTELGRFSE